MISVIIPTLDEASVIEGTLHAARDGGVVEIIIADGGSGDGTPEITGHFVDRIVHCPRGRALQMNEGARAASGDILLFLHADTRLPEGWAVMIESALADGRVAGGAFSFSTTGRSRGLRLVALMVNLRSRLLRLPYGDQGFFIRRGEFEKLGGFREMPLMEDVDIVRRLKKFGRLAMVKTPVVTSSRRWEQEGWIKTTLRNQLLLYLFLFGLSPEKLCRFYKTVR